jgi:hypothetical protein
MIVIFSVSIRAARYERGKRHRLYDDGSPKFARVYLRSTKVWLLYFAAFARVCWGRWKYPQLYFILLPIGPLAESTLE